MPIEVREVIIRSTIDDGPPKEEGKEIDLETLKKQIMEECKKTIKELVKKQQHR